MPTAVVQAQPAAAVRRSSRTHQVARLLSLSPIAVLVAVLVDPNGSGSALARPVPELFGLPAHVLLTGLVLGWTLVGGLIVWRTRSPLAQSLALLVFTIPATVAAVLGPWVLLAAPSAA